jgi:3-phenylpropionate/trans-cinnamate dioxygenase ferredoxin reductase subunit
VVIGGGFIGVEAGASLAAIGARVTVLEARDRLWGGAFGPTVTDWGREALASAGVEVRFGARVTGVDERGVQIGAESWSAGVVGSAESVSGGERVWPAESAPGELLPADVVLIGVGVQPRLDLTEGLALDGAGGPGALPGVAVDVSRRTSSPAVYAAGDIAAVPHSLADGRRIRVEHWHAAREGGEAAALAMLDLPVPVPRAPWLFSEFAGQTLDVIGWAPSWDEEMGFGDPQTGRFAVAYVVGGSVRQLALVNGFVDVVLARAFIEGGGDLGDLDRLIGR